MSASDRYTDGEGVQYRRGALMGFTVAESFMLIAFALLLLLALWRYQDAERARLVDDLTPFQRNAITQLVRDGSLDGLLALPRGGDQRDALRDGAQIVRNDRLSDLEASARLVAEEDVRLLAEAAAKMPPDLRRKLTDLVRLEDYRDELERIEALLSSPDARAMAEAATKLPAKAQKDLLAAMQDPSLSDKLAAVEALDASGIPADQVPEALELARQLEEGKARAGATGQRVAAKIRERLGMLVNEMGGEITESGDVVLPEEITFDPGSSKLKPIFQESLRNFCPRWLNTLYDEGPSLAAAQIGGHASSEWKSLDPQAAYLENLRLSQERARAVFTFCLSLVGGNEVGLWARERLSAVGYSSARRVMVNGQEDRERSRRVVFGFDVARSTLLEQLDEKKEKGFLAPTGSFGDLLGDKSNLLEGLVTHVRDGDTFLVGAQPVRLQGLHAPELSDEGGKAASDKMRDLVLGQAVSCRLTGETSYDRVIGVCEQGGEDVAIALVRAGLARDCPAYSGGRYAAYETATVKTMKLPAYCID